MFFQSIEIDFLRDLLLILRFFAIFLLFYILNQLNKKIKRGKIYSITYGFGMFILSVAIFHLCATIEFFYPSNFHNPILYAIRLIALFIGMFLLMLTSEIEYVSHFSERRIKYFPYPPTG